MQFSAIRKCILQSQSAKQTTQQKFIYLFIFADLLLHVPTFILHELQLFGSPVVSQYSASLSISFKYMF